MCCLAGVAETQLKLPIPDLFLVPFLCTPARSLGDHHTVPACTAAPAIRPRPRLKRAVLRGRQQGA